MGFDSAAAAHLVGAMDLHTRNVADRGTRRGDALAITVALVQVALAMCPSVRAAYQPSEDSVRDAVALISQARPATTLAEVGLLFGARSEATMHKWLLRKWRGLPVPAMRVGALLSLTLGSMSVGKRREAIERMLSAAELVKAGGANEG